MLKIFLIGISFLSGYLFTEWTAAAAPFSIHGYLLGLVLHPLEFFAASLSFFSGISVNAYLFRQIAKIERSGGKNGYLHFSAFLILAGLLLAFIALYSLSPVHTLVFFGSSLVYGIISIYF